MEFIITQLNDNNRDDLSAMPEVLSVLIWAFNQGWGEVQVRGKTFSLLGQLGIKTECPERLCILHP